MPYPFLQTAHFVAGLCLNFLFASFNTLLETTSDCSSDLTMENSFEAASKRRERESSVESINSPNEGWHSPAEYGPRYLKLNSEDQKHHGLGFVDAVQGASKAVQDERDRIAQARIQLGTIVKKRDGFQSFMGHVVWYDVRNDWFKVVFEDGEAEAVNWNELGEMIAPPDLVDSYLDELWAREEEKYIRTRKAAAAAAAEEAEAEEAAAAAAEAEAVAAAAAAAAAAEEAKKAKRKRAKESKVEPNKEKYVPLAIREKKKDAYYWFD